MPDDSPKEPAKTAGTRAEMLARKAAERSAAPPPPAAVPSAAASPAPTPAALAAVTVEVEGQTLQVSPQVAAAIDSVKTAATRANDATLAGYFEEIKQLLTKPTPTGQPDVTPSLTLPDSNLLISDPAAYNRELKMSLEQRDQALVAQMERRQQAREAARQQEANLARLRVGFYEVYPDFKGSETVVDQVLRDTWTCLAASGRDKRMTVAEGYKEVAATATVELAKVIGVAQRMVAAPRPPHLEGAGHRAPDAVRPKPPTVAEPAQPRSLSEAIRELRAKHGLRRHEIRPGGHAA